MFLIQSELTLNKVVIHEQRFSEPAMFVCAHYHYNNVTHAALSAISNSSIIENES